MDLELKAHWSGLSQLADVQPITLYELNGRPVAIREVPGAAKCSLCSNVAKLTVFEMWRGKCIGDNPAQEHRVWHWCGECEESPAPAFTPSL